MSRSSNKSKVECLMQYLTTLTRKPKQRRPEDEDKVSPSYRVNMKGSKRR